MLSKSPSPGRASRSSSDWIAESSASSALASLVLNFEGEEPPESEEPEPLARGVRGHTGTLRSPDADAELVGSPARGSPANSCTRDGRAHPLDAKSAAAISSSARALSVNACLLCIGRPWDYWVGWVFS